MATVKVEIKSRWNASVLFAADIDASICESLRIRAALVLAVKRCAYLGGADLRSADLRSADLGGADLRGADLRSANLYSANLYSANLYSANLYGADLRSAYLGGANLYSAYLGGADLRGAYLGGAKVDGFLLVGDRPVLQIGPLGSRSDYLLAFLTDQGISIRAGCFAGTLAEFAEKAKSKHGDNKHGREYAAAIAMIEAHAAIWTPADAQNRMWHSPIVSDALAALNAEDATCPAP